MHISLVMERVALLNKELGLGGDFVLGLGWGRGSPRSAPRLKGEQVVKGGLSLEYVKGGGHVWQASPSTKPTIQPASIRLKTEEGILTYQVSGMIGIDEGAE